MLFSRWVHPNNAMCKSSEYHFLSGGAAGVNFWKLEGSTLSKKQGRFSKKYKASPLLCAANIQGKDSWRMVIGTASGDLYLYDERETSDAVEGAHKGPVLCVAEGGIDCLFLVSGGRDGLIKVWNQALQPMSIFDITSYSCVDASVASLDVRPGDDGDSIDTSSGSSSRLVLLAGTYGGEIIEVSSAKSDSNSSSSSNRKTDGGGGEHRNLDLSHASAEVLLYSHYSGELWGLATHPLDPDIIATVGDDRTLRIWSIKRNAMLKVVKLYWPARSVAWHPLGTALAVGFHEAVKGGYKKNAAAASSSGGGGKKKKVAEGEGFKKGAKVKAGSAETPYGEDGEDTAGDSGSEMTEGTASTAHKGAIHLYSFSYHNTSSSSSNNNKGRDSSSSNDQLPQVEIKKRADGCKSIAWIGDIKFSPNGRILAAGSHDKRLYAYDVPALLTGDASNDSEWETWMNCLNNKPKFEFNKHSSSVNHFDFSLDGQYFQSTCQAGELLFGYPDSGKQETSASKLADYNGQLDDESPEGRLWATQTCTLGWPVQGIWPPGADTSDINAVDRHVNGKLLATADDFGHVKLFRYPCVQDGSSSVVGDGHSSHVTCVRWTVANHLISVGGNDKCIFIWNLVEK